MSTKFNDKWFQCAAIGVSTTILLCLITRGCERECSMPPNILELNNALLRDHLAGLGIWVTVTTVAFTILTITLPYFWNQKLKASKKKIARFEKKQRELLDQLEVSQKKIEMLYETAVSLYIDQIASQMHLVTPTTTNEHYCKNLIVNILRIFEYLPFCSLAAQKNAIRQISQNIIGYWSNESNCLGKDGLKQWIASIMQAPRRFPIEKQALFDAFRNDPDTLEALRNIFEYFV